jgi:predicted ferric reductase
VTKKHVLLSGYLLAFMVGAVLTILTSPHFTAYTAGKILGVWSLTALTFQLVLVTRADIIESAVGYDRITRWHAANGVLIILLVLVHPPLVFAGLGFTPADIIGFVQNTPAAMLGELALALLIVQAVTTLYWNGLDYEHWRIIHRIGYVIVALGFLHSFLLGSDISVPPQNLLSVWWLALAAVSAGSVLYRYGYRPMRKKQRFRVADVSEEAQDVYTVELLPEEDDITHAAGQFAFVTFESAEVPAEEHHFTIASAPDRDGFEYTIKDVGDFTAQIQDLQAGDTAIVEGPYGAFTLDEDADSLVMVAGGIGITPLMSMLRYMDETDRGVDTQLLYGNQTRNDIAFKEELDVMEAENDWLTVTHVLSEEDVDGYEHGFIDEALLAETDTDAQYYVCGPPPMMDAVADALHELGVDASQVHMERFSLRDINWRRGLPFF